MNIGDVVKLTRGTAGAERRILGLMDWKILKIDGRRAQVDLVSGSLLGPQWELLTDLTPIPVRPDPTKTGPCELQLSFVCTGAGYERLDPRDMLAPETSFRTPRIICVECNDMAATIYVREVHS